MAPIRPFPPCVAAALLLALLVPAFAQATIPNFWDARRRPERPELAGIAQPVRFVTAPDHPPFNFLNAAGELTGFNVELVRAVCLELALACTIQARAFDTIVPALAENRADAAAAGIALTADIRQRFEVGDVYLRSPARFAVRRDSQLAGAEPSDLAGRRVAVIAGTAHAAFLRAQFPGVVLVPFDEPAAARQALRSGGADALFDDGVALALWLNGTVSDACCVFRGGPYLESRFFGDGFALVFRADAEALRRAADYALQRLFERGVYAELTLRWFPVGLY